MAQPQAGAPQGAEQPGVSVAPAAQMEAQQPRMPQQAAVGSGGGAALVFRDYASI